VYHTRYVTFPLVLCTQESPRLNNRLGRTDEFPIRVFPTFLLSGLVSVSFNDVRTQTSRLMYIHLWLSLTHSLTYKRPHKLSNWCVTLHFCASYLHTQSFVVYMCLWRILLGRDGNQEPLKDTHFKSISRVDGIGFGEWSPRPEERRSISSLKRCLTSLLR